MISVANFFRLLRQTRGSLPHAFAVVLLATGLCTLQPVAALNLAQAKVVATFLKGARSATVALPDAKILEFAEIAAQSGGTKEVGKALGKMNLPDEVLEDTFARIIVAQGRVQRDEAEGWMQRLGGVQGFRSALSKSMGPSSAMTAGHVNEIRIADSAAKYGFKVNGIGVPFNDPNKQGITDIDVLLEFRGRQVAIEAKDYLPDTPIPMDSFRADMLTLAEYRGAQSSSNVLPVFWISNKPADLRAWKLMQAAASRHEVELIVGAADTAIHEIPLLFR